MKKNNLLKIKIRLKIYARIYSVYFIVFLITLGFSLILGKFLETILYLVSYCVFRKAFGSETITTADTELRTITFSTIVRVLPGSTVNLSLVNTGVATTATKVDLIIEKLN